MAPINWAASGGVKIERANEHIRNLVTEIKAFLKTGPYAVKRQLDNESREWVFRAIVREPPPLRWGAIAGDAIHNLRSTLDVLYGIVFHPRGGSYFPFFPSADEYAAHFRRPVKPSRQTAVDLLKATKAYPGGNDILWLLHSLDRENKHRTLVPALLSNRGTEIMHTRMTPWPRTADGRVRFRMPGFSAAMPETLCPVEDGAILCRVSFDPDYEVKVDAQRLFDIAFGELGIAKGKAIVPTLHQFSQMVEGISKTFLEAGLLI